jgi:hypothetical protein
VLGNEGPDASSQLDRVLHTSITPSWNPNALATDLT